MLCSCRVVRSRNEKANFFLECSLALPRGGMKKKQEYIIEEKSIFNRNSNLWDEIEFVSRSIFPIKMAKPK